jgi:hypothetical protein
MANTQKFLLDDKKLGRLLKVDIFETKRTLKTVNIIGKKATETKKKYLLTVYNKVIVNEQQIDEEGKETFLPKEKFIKWAEFDFSVVMHPRDRIIEFLSKTERPMKYIPDMELMDELVKRELTELKNYPDELFLTEIKRRGLTEFANNFKISKNATLYQKLKARIKKHKKIPNSKLTFEETIIELKKRKLLLPKDFMTDDDLLIELEKRDLIKKQTPPDPERNSNISDILFEDISIPETPHEEVTTSPDEIDPAELMAHIK